MGLRTRGILEQYKDNDQAYALCKHVKHTANTQMHAAFTTTSPAKSVSAQYRFIFL
jgi:hypothetical protein